MRNKKLLWILVMLVLVVGSIAVEGAITDTIRGLTSKVSGAVGGVSITHILVNTILIGLFIFIVVNLLPDSLGGNIFKPKSNVAKSVFFIALIGISIFFAIRLGGVYIWNEEATVRPAFRYLFGEEPLGILRPTRILIFMGASFLLSWLFIQVVKIGQGKNKIDIVIATILAAEMTHQGLTKGMLIILGQIISIGLLYRQFKREGETGWSPSATVWSWGLVLWISAIAFPGQGFLAPFTGIVRAMGYFTYLLLLIILGIGAIVFGKFLKRREGEAREKPRWLRDGVVYGAAGLANWALSSKNMVLQALRNVFQIREPTLKGWLPFEFRRRKVELAVLMNYLLRLEVYLVKSRFVKFAGDFIENEVQTKYKSFIFGGEEIDGIRNVRGANRVKSDAWEYKVGFESYFDKKKQLFYGIPRIMEFTYEDGELHIKDKPKDSKYIKDAKRLRNWGWSNHRHLIFVLFNQLKKILENESYLGGRVLDDTDVHLRIWQGGTKEKEAEEEIEKLKAYEETGELGAEKKEPLIDTTLGAFLGYKDSHRQMVQGAEKYCCKNMWWRKFWVNNEHYGLTQIRDSHAWAVMDQNNVNGLYRHTYRFARPHSKPAIIPVERIEDPETGDIVIKENFDRCTKEGNIPHRYKEELGVLGPKMGASRLLYEVDERGVLLDDLNKIKIENERSDFLQQGKIEEGFRDDGGFYYRKISPENIIMHNSIADVFSNITQEWTFFINDIRTGRFHKFSRTAKDYIACHDRRDFGYSSFERKNVPSDKVPAFDREALKNPGGFIYRGKSRYDVIDPHELDEKPKMHAPCVTTKGLTLYLKSRIDKKAANLKVRRQHFKDWAWENLTEGGDIFVTGFELGGEE